MAAKNPANVTTYQDLEPNFDGFEGEPALNDTDWGYDTRSTNATHLREASVGDELILNDRKRPLRVREVALADDAGPYGRKRLFLQGNGCDYMVEVDLFHTRARFVLLPTGRATESRDLGTLEWVIPDSVVNAEGE